MTGAIPKIEWRGGFGYSKHANNQPKPKVQPCRRAGCPRDATCMPRLYVPRHPMSIVRGDDISAMMGIALCDVHFRDLKPGQFLHRQEVRDQFADLFRQRNAIPNFDKAVIGRIPLYDPDYARITELEERHRRTAGA